jgi:hypothetical protein
MIADATKAFTRLYFRKMWIISFVDIIPRSHVHVVLRTKESILRYGFSPYSTRLSCDGLELILM